MWTELLRLVAWFPRFLTSPNWVSGTQEPEKKHHRVPSLAANAHRLEPWNLACPWDSESIRETPWSMYADPSKFDGFECNARNFTRSPRR